jgi:hypothetical protein
MTRPHTPLLALSLVIAMAGLSACDKEAGRKQETVGKVESGVGNDRRRQGPEGRRQEGQGRRQREAGRPEGRRQGRQEVRLSS